MPRNYNTTLGKPYIRANQVVINYNTEFEKFVEISISENEAIIDSEGKARLLQSPTNSFSKTLSATELATQSFPLINPATGEAIGQNMSLAALAQAITSYVRAIQNEKYPQT